MGMAASQARLLSITSRMSDNELRSQLINNAKMRLTTDSSKASEKYLAALNESILMFSNYNLEGESQYQQLNFNNLTAYSAYNNQYGLANKGGELLVSELDSARYEAAFAKAYADNSIDPDDVDGRNAKALEEFLASYGLVKDTTYFERAELYAIDPKMKEIYEGDMVREFHAATETSEPYAERINGIHYGYQDSLNTKDYGIYLTLFNNYTQASNIYNGLTLTSMQNYINNIQHKESGIGNTYSDTYRDMLSWANSIEYNDDGELVNKSSDVAKAKQFMEAMQDIYNYIYNDGKFKDGSTAPVSGNEQSGSKWNNNNRYSNSNNCEDEKDAFHYRMQYYLDLTEGGVEHSTPTQAYARENYSYTLIPGTDDDGDGVADYYYYIINDADQDNHPVKNPLEKIPDYQVQTGTDDEGNPIYTTVPVMEIKESIISPEEYVSNVIDMYYFFQGEILNYLDQNEFKDAYVSSATSTTDISEADAKQKFDDARDSYYKASKELSLFIFGQDVGSDYYENLGDLEWCIYGPYKDPAHPEEGRVGTPIYPTTAIDGSEGGTVYYMDFLVAGSLDAGDLPYQANFQVVKDIYLSETMMELYGTPSYTWIDTNNRDEDGEKKAQWYTNLFNRMLEGGYQTLENGLASSSEWLQFALESGLISMEQVDIKNFWVSTMYSNCSNITESQVDVDITIAEAEYNKTMNEIEAKDKRYDIELKNIDTEHQSLQTEYDSIKSVIDKNIERNFKMFEA